MGSSWCYFKEECITKESMVNGVRKTPGGYDEEACVVCICVCVCVYAEGRTEKVEEQGGGE